MFQPHLPETEIMYRNQKLADEYLRAQRQISVAGLRQILGNTIIEIGSRIHGMARESCAEAAETHANIRDALSRSSQTTQAHIH